jgi:beta-lactamase class D
MNKINGILIIIFTLFIVSSCSHKERNNEWNTLFDKYNASGTFILKNTSTNTIKIFNKERCDSAFLPASTFKIMNSLVSLQTKVIKDVNDTIKWDGIDRGWNMWNMDQTMKTALPISCVWFYQELARRVGKNRMQKWIDKCDYGNKKLGKEIDNFWLEGDIRISAKEQVYFLEKLVNNELPFDTQYQEIVKQIMITDSTKNYIIHSKTGWTKNIGWNVGFVETKNNVWVFAMNMVLKSKDEAFLRKKITYEVLKSESVIK